MSKTVNYMVLDTETATLPFVNSMGLSADEKKKIAIAKPLVYDIGWTIANRPHGIVNKRNYLIAETFCNADVFNTAYYACKLPIYADMISKGEIEVKTWNEVMAILQADLVNCDYICAYNAMFDFKKAIPFTELYISKLYSGTMPAWLESQKHFCENILTSPAKKSNPEFDKDNFILRGEKYPMIDIWGIACVNLLNTDRYRNTCLENGYITNSGTFFSSNAENCMRYLESEYDFIEDHTALSDAEIETAILLKGIRRGKRFVGIEYFPFRKLGDTVEYARAHSGKLPKESVENIANALTRYLDGKTDFNAYDMQIARKLDEIESLLSIYTSYPVGC